MGFTPQERLTGSLTDITNAAIQMIEDQQTEIERLQQELDAALAQLEDMGYEISEIVEKYE